VKNAHKRKTRARDPEDDNRTLYTLTKGDDRGKIDAAVADVLAFEAAMTMPAEDSDSVYEERGLVSL
jgi:phage terminase large subunit-like protein